jgi:hypothetical protein
LSWLDDVFGLGTMDQDVPFHDSIRVCSTVGVKYHPTVKQLVGAGQATLWRTLIWLDDVFGLETMDQDEVVVAFADVPETSDTAVTQSPATTSRLSRRWVMVRFIPFRFRRGICGSFTSVWWALCAFTHSEVRPH